MAGWCGSFRGVPWLGLVRPSVSVPCLGVVVCCGAPCCVVPYFAVLRRVGPRCVAVRPAVPRRVAPCRAVMCRSVPRHVASCCAVCGLGCLVVLPCTVVRCGAVCRAASCCAVVGRLRLVWPVSSCGVRVGVWLVGGCGVRSGVGGSLCPCCGGLGLPLGLVGRVGVRGVALPGGLRRGQVSSGGPGP